uniref:Uncharacterized protein n=1 Tax=Aplanochytrium stocchinoi TaxID=215587 RepID=A0A7S3V1Q9_9STRA|mmetsp:Transcript_11159/g.13937  ORF Transcript_11159/g.13937 Transcript_11159/m.13937 type:complete len:162 (-) Transcript_11159:769-1254(-)
MELTITFNPLTLLAFLGCTVLFLIYIYRIFKADVHQSISNIQEKVRRSAVEECSKLIAQVLQKPEVHNSLTNIIAAGITAWVVGDGQEHVAGMIDGTNQKKVAREIGKQFPSMVSAAAGGVLDSFNPFKSRNNNKKQERELKKFHMSDVLEDDGTSIYPDD